MASRNFRKISRGHFFLHRVQKAGFHATIFSSQFITVSLYGQSERRTNRSLSKGKSCNIARHCLQQTLKFYAQFRWRGKQVSREISPRLIV